VRRSRPATRWLCFAIAAAIGATGCGGHARILTGVGGVHYRWPPPASDTKGPPSPARFCRLLVDDYENLKTLQQATTVAGKDAIARQYVSFVPVLEASAPGTVAASVKTYVGSVAPLLNALIANDFNALQVPTSTYSILNRPDVSAAYNQLIAYSKQDCGYNLPADSGAGGA
jgi:hypothetical protein